MLYVVAVDDEIIVWINQNVGKNLKLIHEHIPTKMKIENIERTRYKL